MMSTLADRLRRIAARTEAAAELLRRAERALAGIVACGPEGDLLDAAALAPPPGPMPTARTPELVEALAVGALDRARALFPEAVGRELWELACLGDRDRIRAELEALAEGPAAGAHA